MEAVKIAFIGTHGVGKTTLMYKLAGKLKMKGVDVEVNREVVRDCPFPINQAATKDGQRWILFTQMERELTWRAHLPERGKGIKALICDRATLDNYAYYINAVGRDSAVEPLIAEWIKSYAYLIYVPVAETVIEADGFRDTDRIFQRKIDKLVLQLCDAFKVEPIKLDPAKHSRWMPDLTRIAQLIAKGKRPKRDGPAPARDGKPRHPSLFD